MAMVDSPTRSPAVASDVAGIVLAAGNGRRFGGPKQFETVGGMRMVDRAVELLRPFCDHITVVLTPGRLWDGPAVDAVVPGGLVRTESVRRGFAAVPSSAALVVVHDSARPLATAGTVMDVIAAIRGGADAAVPMWLPPDTVKRQLPNGVFEHVGRDDLRITQVPMAFGSNVLRRLFVEFAEVLIEETIGIEAFGGRVVAVAGDPWSHHVVTPRDIRLADALLALRE